MGACWDWLVCHHLRSCKGLGHPPSLFLLRMCFTMRVSTTVSMAPTSMPSKRLDPSNCQRQLTFMRPVLVLLSEFLTISPNTEESQDPLMSSQHTKGNL